MEKWVVILILVQKEGTENFSKSGKETRASKHHISL